MAAKHGKELILFCLFFFNYLQIENLKVKVTSIEEQMEMLKSLSS